MNRRNTSIQWLSLIAIAGAILMWIISLTLGFIDPSHNLVSYGLSMLGRPEAMYPLIYRTFMSFWSFGIVAFAAGIGLKFWDGWQMRTGIILLALCGVGGIISSVFTTNPANPIVDMFKLLGGMMSYFLGLIAVPFISWQFYKREEWPGYRSRGSVIGITLLVISTFVIFFFPKLFLERAAWEGIAGLLQYPNIVVISGWIIYNSFKLYRLADTD